MRTRTLSFRAAALAALILAAGTAAAATPDRAALREQIAAALKARGLVGLSAAVVENGTTLLAEGFGKRSLQTGEPVTADTMFAIGSITKQFTAACVLLLAEDAASGRGRSISSRDPAIPTRTRAT
jgi:D-alanyl-D-alanine carboxypeptidase